MSLLKPAIQQLASEILSFVSGETTREAREVLGFKGSIQFEEVDANEWRNINTEGDAVTYSEGPPWKHVIKYPLFIPMNEQTALHELTHVILNEIGFRDIEILSKKIVESKSKTGRESIWKKATYCVAEPYAEWVSIVLFDRKLRSSAEVLERALTRRNEIVNRYKKDQESGMALALSYRMLFVWLGRPINLDRPSSSWAHFQTFRQIEDLFLSLPKLDLSVQLSSLSEDIKQKIASKVAELYFILVQ
jgi:hypothetical protein